MQQRKKIAWAELKVGVFVVVALAVLIIFILNTAWGGKLLSFREHYFYAKTYLPSVERLKPGAPVWLTGLEIGKVTKLIPVHFKDKEVFDKNQAILKEIQELREKIEKLAPETKDYAKIRSDLFDKIRDKKAELRTVEVLMKIEKQFKDRIGIDSEVNIGSQGLISESYIDISVGSFEQPALQVWDPDLKEDIVLIKGVRTPGFREILTGANDVIANFGVLSEKVKVFLNQIDIEGIGKTIGGISTGLDESLKSARAAFTEGTKLVQEMRTGEGSIAKFVNDPVLYENLAKSMKNFEELTTKFKGGDGTLPRLINDPGMYEKVDTILGRIERGEGALGKLSKDEALYDSTKISLDKFAELMQRLDRGEGSAGRFFKDPSLYDNANKTAEELKALVTDVRKNPRGFLRFNFNLIKLF